MSSGHYVAYSGAAARLGALETIANNVANADTAGFRRDRTLFDMVLGAERAFVKTSSGQVDTTPASARLTGSPLHAAITGSGYFAVQSPSGGERYTRRGDFQIDDLGQLVLPDGSVALGNGGPIGVPPGAAVELRGDGVVVANGEEVGRLRVVDFGERPEFTKTRDGLLASRGPGTPVERPQLQVGFVEASNVNVAAEMVALIQAARAFEASLQAMRTSDSLTQQWIRAQG
jgi:flagellar basal body rod protein FlgG